MARASRVRRLLEIDGALFERYARLDLPILTITGHYDGDQVGALTYYRNHMRLGSPAARDRHYLIIGPWDYSGTRTPEREVGGLKLGETSVLDVNDLHRQWYDWTMKGGARPPFLQKRVAYYVVGPGAEKWKYADTLEEVGAQKRTLYLASENGRADDAFHSGSLAEASRRRTPRPTAGLRSPGDPARRGAEREIVETPFTDQSSALNLYGNGASTTRRPSPSPPRSPAR